MKDPRTRLLWVAFQLAFLAHAADPTIPTAIPTMFAGSKPGVLERKPLFKDFMAINGNYTFINHHTYAAIDRKNSAESPWNRSYPEDTSLAYLKTIDEAIAWRDQNAIGKEIWVTEFGYDACTPEAMKRRTDWFLKLDLSPLQSQSSQTALVG